MYFYWNQYHLKTLSFIVLLLHYYSLRMCIYFCSRYYGYYIPCINDILSKHKMHKTFLHCYLVDHIVFLLPVIKFTENISKVSALRKMVLAEILHLWPIIKYKRTLKNVKILHVKQNDKKFIELKMNKNRNTITIQHCLTVLLK